MLQTTVAYLSLLENKRHNVVSEKQTNEQIAVAKGELEVHRGQLAETQRHNVQTESLGWASLQETVRHNTVTEGINQYDAQTRRQQLDINWYQAETNRYAAEQNAAIGWANVSIGSMNAETTRQRVENDFAISLRTSSASLEQARAAKLNAETKASELEQRKWKDTADVQNKQKELDIQQQNANWNKVNIIWSNYNDAMGNAVRAAETGRKLFWTLVPKG
jgi:hypothetical protein